MTKSAISNQQHLHRAADAVQVSEIENQALPLPLSAMVESLLFVSSEPVPVSQIAEALSVSVDEVEQVLAEFRDDANSALRGLRLQRKGERVQLTTRPETAPWIEKFLGLDLSSRLSKPALETLAIVAYKQPVTRAQIEQVRGVNCDAVLSTLLTKGLIEEVGRLETAGRPIQYSTTFAFLQHFGLRGLEDMPPLQPEEVAVLEAMVMPNAGPSASSEQVPLPADPPVAVTDVPAVMNDQLPLLDEEQSVADVQILPVADPQAVANDTAPTVNDQLPLAADQ
jgi:segregation and condensation protein B